MKLRSVTKLDKEIKRREKNLAMSSCQKIMTSLLIFGFIADLE